MADTKYWDERNQTIVSSVGHWSGGNDVNVRGYSLMNELMGNVSYLQLVILNATGKFVARNIADWLEVCFMGLSYPDSRIWCNQIAAYAADTNTSVVASATSAILAADSRAYGGSQARKLSMQAQLEMYKNYKEGISLGQIIKSVKFKNGKPIIVGFARPIDRDDERLKPFSDVQKKLGIEQGEYLKFALKLSQYLNEHYQLSINCGGYASAFLLDHGFTPEEGYKINAFAVVSGAVACFNNFEKQSANSFIPMKCQDIEYIGRAPRAIEE
ncbi:hypothetical protein C2869_13685 [Saccharobesus litoralis]|uniref:Citrate synthase n=1 Tax=Saccharobesus litoralis TaxID=2172099 RepID=A0A2S0VT80_9ALTE|nr:hypothetical protein [Saccharobesus litoralis]AWB67426.1 hypothetical protein C2869_13685 [Saccharobesus litoralis]